MIRHASLKTYPPEGQERKPVMQYLPRNTYVLVRRVKLGETPGGVLVPDASIEGVEHIVVAVGPKVEELAVGDKVLMIGQFNLHYSFLPNSKELIIIKEENVALVYWEG